MGIKTGIADGVFSGNSIFIEQRTQNIAITDKPKEIFSGSYVIASNANGVIFGGNLADLDSSVDPLIRPVWSLSDSTDILTLSRSAYVKAAASDGTNLTLFVPTLGSPVQWNRATAASVATAGGTRTLYFPNWLRRITAAVTIGGVVEYRVYDPVPSPLILTGLDASSVILLFGHFQW